MILRFTANLQVPFNSTAELPATSVKVQQRSSGGCWRTLQGLINFAIDQSYLSTATKWDWTGSTCSNASSPPTWLPHALTPDTA
jgi:transposase